MKRPLLISLACVLVWSTASRAAHHENQHELNALGTWEVAAAMDLETRESTLVITQTEEGLQAVVLPEEGGEMTMTRASVEGTTLTFELDFDRDGQAGVIGAKASLNDKGGLSGEWYARSTDGQEWLRDDWQAARSAKASLAGAWEVVAFTNDNDLEHEIVFTNEDDQWSATARSNRGSMDFAKVRVMKDTLRLEMPWGDGKVRVSAKMTAADRFQGAWTYVDEFGSESATGDWVAEKPAPENATPETDAAE